MQTDTSIIRIAIADDHTLLRNALAGAINKAGNFSVIFEAGNGSELISKVQSGNRPDVILLDLSMPQLDGFEAAAWLYSNHPEIHVLMLTMYDSEPTMLRLLKVGVKGFLKKDADMTELKTAIITVMKAGYYYTNHTTGRLINMFTKHNEHEVMMKTTLTEMEVRFLRWACTDLTYKEIAEHMHLNVRAVDNLRDNLFNKFDVKNRVGLAMYAVKHGIQPI